MAAGVVVMAVVVLLGLVMAALLVGGIALNRKHRREDAAGSADRVNGP